MSALRARSHAPHASPLITRLVARLTQRALCLSAALWSVGCMVAMPISADPSEQNYAPSFPYELVSPDPAYLVTYQPELEEGGPLTFSVVELEDPNEGDSLYWRVFLNYQGRYYNAIYRSNRGEGLPPSARSEGLSFQLSPCLDFKLFPFDGPYRVELVIADRPFRQTDDDSLLINQILPEGAKSTRLHWFVTYERALCPL